MAKTDAFTQTEKNRYLKGRVNKVTNMVKEFYDPEDVQTSVQDALTDILHLCKAKGWIFQNMLESASHHFIAEQTGGEHG